MRAHNGSYVIFWVGWGVAVRNWRNWGCAEGAGGWRYVLSERSRITLFVCGLFGDCVWLFYSSGRLVFCCSSFPLSEQRKKGKKEISILKNVDHRLGLSTVSTGCCEQPNVVRAVAQP